MDKFTYVIAKKEYATLTTKKARREFFNKVNAQLIEGDGYFYSNYLYNRDTADINPVALKLLNEITEDFRRDNISLPGGIDRRLQACTAMLSKKYAEAGQRLPDLGTTHVSERQMKVFYSSKAWTDNILPSWVYAALDDYYNKEENNG